MSRFTHVVGFIILMVGVAILRYYITQKELHMARLTNHADISKGMLGKNLPIDLVFVKSDDSGPDGGNCPEFAQTEDGRIVVRDSHDKEGPVLVFTEAQIAAMAPGWQEGGNLRERFVA